MIYGERFHQVNFDFMPEPNWWLLNVNAKEIRGSAKFYPDWDQQGIDIDADFIHLTGAVNKPAIEKNSTNGLDEKTTLVQVEQTSNKAPSMSSLTSDITTGETPVDGGSTSASVVVKPLNQNPILPLNEQLSNSEIFAAIPPLKVRCASCQYSVYDFGEVTFTLERKNEHTLLLNKFTAKRDKTQLSFDAIWQQELNESSTRVTGALVTNNVAREVENMGYASIIKDSGVEMKYDLTWQGGPHDFAMASFDGELSAKFDDGYLADVDDKGVRILSLLSLQSLVRKLSFDF